jgi:TPR repeat protein
MDQRPKAIPYLNSAAQLGYPQAHLRLAWIYVAGGSKDKAALEYEQFLRKTPDYPHRQKLERYIQANKKN